MTKFKMAALNYKKRFLGTTERHYNQWMDYVKITSKGFKVADSAAPFFTLLYLPFDEKAPVPQFKACAKQPQIDQQGFVIYYTHACPFPAKYVPLVAQVAKERKIPLTSVLIDSKEKAQNAPIAWTNYAVFYNGKYVSNEILNEKRFLELVERLS